MRKLIRFILLKPVLWLVGRYSSKPDRVKIFEALSKLKIKLETDAGKKGFTLPFDFTTARFIIFSDQHKGARNGADDFVKAEPNYLAALQHYDHENFHLICLGDSEELWENMLIQVTKHHAISFEAERRFALRHSFTKIYGNHDLDWEINPTASMDLKNIYSLPVVALEGILLQTNVADKTLSIFCTHGHQGDSQSDGNWFSKFFVSKIWAPFQTYLRINPNTPAYDRNLKTSHNQIMHEWSSNQKNLVLITGHTHQPVFESLTVYERLYRARKVALSNNDTEQVKKIETELQWRENESNHLSDNYLNMKPSYFNSGCCCFEDGDITGIEIADGSIRLVKWELFEGKSQRAVLEESTLIDLIHRLGN